LDNASNTAGEFTVLLFGIFDIVDVFWDWKLYSFVCGKEVVVKHCAYCGCNTIFLAFLIMPSTRIFAHYFWSSFSFLNVGTRENEKVSSSTMCPLFSFRMSGNCCS